MTTSVEIFHANCFLKWNCYNCPVCFFIRNPEHMKNPVCMRCDNTNAVWFCITCGHVGCSQNEQGHALAHYRETKHKYIMEMENFVVWDYKLKNCVHILEDTEKRLMSAPIKINGVNSCSCPVCQHIETPKLLKKSMCMKCADQMPGSLWICLCCSHVGCSRHKQGHALEHYETTKHSYCMQLVNFSIWDYSQQTYLHRFSHDDIEKRVTTVDAKEHFEKRLDRLENEWIEFERLSEANEKMLRIEQRLLALTYEKTALEVKLQEHDTKLKDLIIQFYGKCDGPVPIKYISSKTYDLNSNQTVNNKVSQTQIWSESCPTKVMNVVRNHDEAKPFQLSYGSDKVSDNVKHSEFMYLFVVTLFFYHFIVLVLQIIPKII